MSTPRMPRAALLGLLLAAAPALAETPSSSGFVEVAADHRAPASSARLKLYVEQMGGPGRQPAILGKTTDSVAKVFGPKCNEGIRSGPMGTPDEGLTCSRR